jgi:hypothetical protein
MDLASFLFWTMLRTCKSSQATKSLDWMTPESQLHGKILTLPAYFEVLSAQAISQ